MSAPPQIQIVGAGIAGLVLGRALRHRGVSAVILDKGVDFFARHRNRHGITLHATAYRPLLSVLGLDDSSFRKIVAVDAAVGGGGRLGTGYDDGSNNDLSDGATEFRANRGRFERLLAEGLEIRWEREVQGLRGWDGGSNEAKLDHDGGGGGGDAEMQFSDGEVWHSDGKTIIVGADGPHSAIRSAVAPSSELEVLPFAVYNGRRLYEAAEFGEAFGRAFENSCVLTARHERTNFTIAIDERTEESVHFSYTYSRPALKGHDPLFRPQRAKSAATEIPEALFEEVQNHWESMDSTFRTVFDTAKMREDRILNWLMRTVDVGVPTLKQVARRGVVLIGDAGHAESILGGYGANGAIGDALELADLLASDGQAPGLEQFYTARSRLWTTGTRRNKERIGSMHHL